ncbi:carbohydrate-binding protein [Streptomyces sp. DSM 110735]|uniref:TIM-barrel domain-containing protein n=1 Tax=Streptomyces sp. DSM 110735 TaxID=2775031 RepID=UPI0018F7A624|nr:TIM-barrel domain-containing protein [Streptomyces sp. DSM 110735]MBJ7907297.1 carbohydrate-binding protein [Streptomyces sp. DSM 110735]
MRPPLSRSPRGRLTRIALVCATAALGLTCADPATASPAAKPVRKATVSVQNARFQVLSPTLIRTEYAGDNRFEDGATFNAIGRDGFTPPAYTSTVKDGVLTITTSALTLRYEVGSGPFSADNLTVRLKAGQDQVLAAPWQHPDCAVGALCEAEDQLHDGPGLAADHAGFTGKGFLAGFEVTNNSLTTDVRSDKSGTYDYAVRYANGTGSDSRHETRTLSLSVDGGADRTFSLPATADWNAWGVARVPLTLGAGHHTVRLRRTATDSGAVNIDSAALLATGAAYPGKASTALPGCHFGTSCEAEDALLAGSAVLATDHQGYSGDGFAAELNKDARLTAHVTDVPADGTYLLQLRYANGTGGDGLHQAREVRVGTGTGTDATLTLPATDNWDTWKSASVPVELKAGTNDVTLNCPDATSCHVNADTLAVTARTDPAPQPHLALGGYRRSLDGLNGDNDPNPRTTPGLLHRDGWYLLDDTASATYDTRTEKAVPRPSHGAGPYQDGYLFGYGHDYKQGLTDLATLTGPPQLLPRWAYGVWYSEYIDRTADDYEKTILPAFRKAGVPLDVLVTDTDFKSPNTWSGWNFDPAKYPDPKGFFDWSTAEGLHNTLNVHPSILESDPQYAKAMATAKNKLAKGGCAASAGSACRTFDFGDPDQLKAYLDLHRPFDRAGNDFWWLDWCCDASRSSQPGVTPDAWINQKYANLTAETSERGFVLSRAYGSLQAGGYSGGVGLPTGPWADKRSTLHFTGDTSSTWGTLRAEVGYTPGESVATGMAAVSHDIGGHNDGHGIPGAETYTTDDGQSHRTTKLPDDLYARWVQFGTFQPVDRLHSNHSDRLPWQYGDAARDSASKFLNLRESLVPYTYTLAQQANTTGVPITRPLYLDYPEEENAYGKAGDEYLYGPDMLVAPVTTPGTSTTTSVWFPPGQWTDYFTGRTYSAGTGGATYDVTTTLDTMPVFVRAGGIVTTRATDVDHDAGTPLDKVAVSVATGAPGSFTLYEDDGVSTPSRHHAATTRLHYTEHSGRHTLRIDPAKGSFHGQVSRRSWTVTFQGADHAPTRMTVGGRQLARSAWKWDADTGSLRVTLPAVSVRTGVTVEYRQP